MSHQYVVMIIISSLLLITQYTSKVSMFIDDHAADGNNNGAISALKIL